MIDRRIWNLSRALGIAIAAALTTPAIVMAQTAPHTGTTSTTKTAETRTAGATEAARPAAETKLWKLPYTPDGQPDLQGYWTSLSFTPMERPAKYNGREFLTKQEMQEVYKSGVQHTYEFTFANSAETPVYDATVYALGAWQNGVQPNPRSSLIVDPPDGHFPPLTPEAAKKRAAMMREAGAANADGVVLNSSIATDEERDSRKVKADTPADLGLGVRCLTFGGPPILPGAYDSNTHIVQGEGYVLLEYEWGSEPRIIPLGGPLDGAPHVSSDIHPWHGDSRGHWEGNTLVVETTNFRPGATYQGTNAKTLKITEYFTRTNENTIEYKFTINDPTTWTKPWTAIVPLSKVNGPMFEYACSEGNNGLINTMAGARADEKAAKEKQKDTSSPISKR